MNEDLLELSNMILDLENNGNMISSVITELSKEFAQEEKVSIQELIFKLAHK